MATAKLALKESLLGTTTEPELSQQTKATFDRNARQDEATGEYFMTEEDFVNAIAPATENYVSYGANLALPSASMDEVSSADMTLTCSTR